MFGNSRIFLLVRHFSWEIAVSSVHFFHEERVLGFVVNSLKNVEYIIISFIVRFFFSCSHVLFLQANNALILAGTQAEDIKDVNGKLC